MNSRSATLIDVLEESKRLGFLGPGPVSDHRQHAKLFVAPLITQAGPRRAGGPDRGWRGDSSSDAGSGGEPSVPELVDLGAGGGVPGLVILTELPQWRAVLLDASQRRCSFLVWAGTELGLADRIEVWCGRAEEIGHEERARFRFDAVVARGFGPPATTAECAAPLLRPGGIVVISEPPGGRSWPTEHMEPIGLVKVDRRTTTPESPGQGSPASDDPGVVVLRRDGDVDPVYPRRNKAQRTRPLFR